MHRTSRHTFTRCDNSVKEEQDKQQRAPELEPYEKVKAREEESLNADITYEVIRTEGEKELERSSSALAWSGLAAGLSMGFSFLAEGLLRHHLPDAAWRPLIVKLGYPLGFIIITLASQQLFTENTVTAVVPFLTKKTRQAFANLLRLWAVVLAANLVGAFLFAWVLAGTNLLDAGTRETLSHIAREAVDGDFAATLVRAVFAGWLIALMVWMLPAASSSRVFVIVAVTYLVGLGGFAHIIAGSTEVLYGVVRSEISLGTYLEYFLAPALIGNSLGGVLLVSSLNHAQVVSGKG
jgi:formate-nitrite transporter family protein